MLPIHRSCRSWACGSYWRGRVLPAWKRISNGNKHSLAGKCVQSCLPACAVWISHRPCPPRETVGARPLVELVTMSKFRIPILSKAQLEFRFENGEVCLYGTKRGLQQFAAICLQLAENTAKGGTNHVHLEDFGCLTKSSLPAVVAVFPQSNDET